MQNSSCAIILYNYGLLIPWELGENTQIRIVFRKKKGGNPDKHLNQAILFFTVEVLSNVKFIFGFSWACSD